MILVLSAIFLSLSLTPVAAEPQPALPIQMSIESEVGANLEKQLPGILNSALTLVQMFPPTGYENNLFHWTSERKILAGKNLTIFFATSHTAALAPLLTNSGASEMDAFTMAPMNVSTKTMSIMLVLLVDKLFFDSQGSAVPNGFSKLVLALAHEIYGNVQYFLEFNMDGAKPQTMADRVNQELKAYRASLLFLGGLQNNSKFATLPLNIREGLLSLLPDEIRAYRTWQRAHPKSTPDPACEAMLKAINTKN